MNVNAYYPTKTAVSKLLVENIKHDSPSNLLDLGAGDGSLLNAALQKWNGTEVTASELDCSLCDLLSKNFEKLKLIRGNSLDLLEKRILKANSFDVAVCNPPYLKYNNSEYHKNLLNAAGFSSCASWSKVPSDLLFLAKNLLLLKSSGHLAIILPDSMLTGEEFRAFRRDLVLKNKVYAVIQLPENIFNNTGAITHIVYVQKGLPSDQRIPLYKADESGSIVNESWASKESLGQRLDFKYWSWFNKSKFDFKQTTLGNIAQIIRRGNSTHNDLKKSNLPFFHTTSFKSSPINIVSDHRVFPVNTSIARAGDILLARVGTRVLGKAVKIKEGYIAYSDCIYCIRVPEKFQDRLFYQFLSGQGQAWFKANSKGVGAQLISKRDLLNFPFDF